MGKENRIYWLDLLKGIGIVLVVFGHFIEPFQPQTAIFRVIFIVIYSFHMPLFCFISGFVCKYKKSTMFYYFIVWFFLQIMYITFFETGYTYQSIISPYWHLWYLYALIIWIASLYVVDKIRNTWLNNLFFVFVIVLAIISGFFEIPYITRAITFYPFFLAGNLYNNFILKMLTKTSNRMIIISRFCLGIIFLSIAYISITKDVNKQILFSYNSYKAGGYTYIDRIIFYTIAFLIIFLIVISVQNIRQVKIELLGQRTLPIFAFHALYVFIFKRNDLFNKIISLGNLWITILWSVFSSSFVIWLLSRKVFFDIFDKVHKKINSFINGY